MKYNYVHLVIIAFDYTTAYIVLFVCFFIIWHGHSVTEVCKLYCLLDFSEVACCALDPFPNGCQAVGHVLVIFQ